MRRNVGRHADRDTARAIDQQVGEARRKHGRFFTRTIVVLREIDSILVEIVEQRVGDLLQPRFGITHRGGRIGVHAAEVALAVDQRNAHRPALRHSGEGIVDRAVAMRVIVTHHVTDDLRALAIGTPGDEPAFLAGEEDATVNGLQAVAHIGQRAAHDHAHRVIEIARLHFIDDVDAIVLAHGAGRGQGIGLVAQGRSARLVFSGASDAQWQEARGKAPGVPPDVSQDGG